MTLHKITIGTLGCAFAFFFGAMYALATGFIGLVYYFLLLFVGIVVSFFGIIEFDWDTSH